MPSSPEGASRELQLGQALPKDGEGGPEEDEELHHWKRDNGKAPTLHRFLVDAAALPNLFLWNTQGDIKYVLSGT